MHLLLKSRMTKISTLKKAANHFAKTNNEMGLFRSIGNDDTAKVFIANMKQIELI